MSGASAGNDRPTFDDVVIDKLTTAIRAIKLGHPEVATIAAIVSWRGNLNEARILHGVWLGGEGGEAVVRPDEIMGSIEQTLKMVVQQVSRAGELVDHLRETIEVLGTEATSKHEELQALEVQIKARQQALAELQGGQVRATEPQ